MLHSVSIWALTGSVLASTGAAATAAESSPHAFGPALSSDPTLLGLVEASLAQRPDLAQAQATLQAEWEIVPQAGALPDPIFSLGIQNDGFAGIQIGKMETSFLSVTAAQTFPAYGKRGLRAEVTSLAARQAAADLSRARLTARAEVERAYLELLLVRDRLRLLTRLQAFWTQAEGLSRSRYESGEGPQSDILRAQLERSRLMQRRWSLLADEKRTLATVNRLRGAAHYDEFATTRSLTDLPDPELAEASAAFADAEERSPELEKARAAALQSESALDLAHKDYLPDLTVSAGLMPRWGKYDSMWALGLSFPLPVWAYSRQAHSVAEMGQRSTAANDGAEAIRRLLRERVSARLSALSALTESNRLYRAQILTQSEAAVSTAILQYQVGQVPFFAVLEALQGYLADVSGFYESIAAAHRVDITAREVSLEP